MIGDALGSEKVRIKLTELSQAKATGKLVLTSGDREWKFYFYLGRLLYAISSTHRIRRWYRAITLYNLQHNLQYNLQYNLQPNLQVNSELQIGNVDKDVLTDRLWEYEWLIQEIKQATLNINQAKAIIYTILKEVFFSLAKHNNIIISWYPSPKLKSENQLFLRLSLSGLEIEQICQKANYLWQQWQQMGLDDICPDNSPVLNVKQLKKSPYKLSEDTLIGMKDTFNNQNTLWDISVKKKQSLIVVTRSLHYFIKKGVIEVKELPDLPNPREKFRLVTAATNPSRQPLIACIDDSPVVGEMLEKILTPSGYRVLKIIDPIQGLANLQKQKPVLIFLDLIMPTTNGHHVCNFLRKTSVFAKTPIIILTARDGISDRFRSKFTGASDFLSKSSEPQQILNMVEKHLGTKKSQQFFDSPQLIMKPSLT